MSPALELQAMIISQIKSVSNTITSVSFFVTMMNFSKGTATVGDNMTQLYDLGMCQPDSKSSVDFNDLKSFVKAF